MKLSKVAKLCKDHMNITIVNVPHGDEEVVQWVGTPYALYPFYNLPIMNEKSAFVVFDVEEKKRADFSFREITAGPDFPMRLEETDETERPIEPAHHQIVFESRVYMVFDTSKGVRLVNRSFFSPMMSKLDELMFFERQDARGKIYIAAKLGLLLAGVIMPMSQRRDDDTMLIFAKKLYERMAYARECDKVETTKEPEIVLVDRQTGEVVEEKI